MIVSAIPEDFDQRNEWLKVDIDVNAQNLN